MGGGNGIVYSPRRRLALGGVGLASLPRRESARELPHRLGQIADALAALDASNAARCSASTRAGHRLIRRMKASGEETSRLFDEAHREAEAVGGRRPAGPNSTQRASFGLSALLWPPTGVFAEAVPNLNQCSRLGTDRDHRIYTEAQ